jgi:ribosomal protein S18 acetylase RimI-like enzyme
VRVLFMASTSDKSNTPGERTIKACNLDVNRWQEYREFRLESLRTDPHAFGARLQDMIQKPDSFWKERLANLSEAEGNNLLFVETEGELAGLIGSVVDPAGDPSSPKIISVWVKPKFRGQGISNILMKEILLRLKNQPQFKKAHLGVKPEQESATALYLKFGFIKIEEKKTVEYGKEDVEYIMERKL